MKKNYYYWLLILCVIIYVTTVFVLRPDAATLTHYNISATQLRLLSLAIAVPSVAIWTAAFYGLVNISRYAAKIKPSPDGVGFKYLAWGSIVLGVSMPINAIISRLLSYGAQQNMMPHSVATIITTHMTVTFTFIGFLLLFIGARSLLATVKKAFVPRSHIIAVAVAIILIALPYIVATLMNPSRAVPVPPAIVATYYMSDSWIFFSIILPYILIWIFGFYTTLFLHTYYQNVRGKLYKKSLRLLNLGFFIVILSTIFLQFVTAASTIIYGWGVGAIMLLVYVLLFIIASGYVYVALGAKSLAKIEEVT